MPRASTSLDWDNKGRSARPSVAGRMAGVKAGCEGQSTRKVRGAIQLPTPDQEIGGPANVSGVLLSMAERQLVDLGKDENVVAIVVVRTVVNTLVVASRPPIEARSGVLPSVVPIEGQPAPKALLHVHLQPVLFVLHVVPYL